jgi:hypothetical protein
MEIADQISIIPTWGIKEILEIILHMKLELLVL